MSEKLYIWIARWEDFQHYRPKPERGPAWIKQYTAQLSDERYLNLSPKARCVLHELRIIFGTMRQRVPNDTRTISGLLAQRVTNVTLEALNQAGLIEFVSRETLEQRLDHLYKRSRAEVEVEVEKERTLTHSPTTTTRDDPDADLEPTDNGDRRWTTELDIQPLAAKGRE